MLAATTTDTLCITDPAVLKKAPSSIPSCLDLIDPTTASSWSPDNALLYLSSAHTIHKYDPSLNSLTDVYTSIESDAITHLVSKDRGTLLFAAGDKVQVVEDGKVTKTFDSHKSSVTSLSLSNDSTLLASTSTGAAHVYNLPLGSHTVLRGLTGQSIHACTFHPHARTRLLLASGKQLMVFDTTRPSGPSKTIAMSESTSGNITSVACSPFSKTLVAVATSGGFVGLIDLEKEKALFRTLNLKVPLTSIGFSPEGAAIYLGTENGKLLITDLRALDKPPKTVVLSETGSRIETISVQKKIKATPDASAKPSATPATAELTRRTSATAGKSAVPSPARPRAARVGSGASPAPRRLPSTLKDGGVTSSPLKKTSGSVVPKKKVFSPARDPHGNSGSGGDISVELETLGTLRSNTQTTPAKKGENGPSVIEPSPTTRTTSISAGKLRSSAAAVTPADDAPPRARTVPSASSRTRKTSTTSTTTSIPPQSTSSNDRLAVPTTKTRPRAASSASRAGSESASTRSTRTASTTCSSRPSSSASRAGERRSASPVPPVPSLPRSISRTPSPEIPPPHAEPMTPIPVHKQKSHMGVQGLSTPEVDRWIKAGKGVDVKERERERGKAKGKGKTVGFREAEPDDEEQEKEKERERSLTLQVSPMRRRSTTASSPPSTSNPALHQDPSSWAPSPLRSNKGGGSAHDLLKTIVQDVMYDYQRETRAEMVGLHLDLVRMGRGWKTELRTLMDEYVGDLKDLREENRMLREENERLRRGYY